MDVRGLLFDGLMDTAIEGRLSNSPCGPCAWSGHVSSRRCSSTTSHALMQPIQKLSITFKESDGRLILVKTIRKSVILPSEAVHGPGGNARFSRGRLIWSVSRFEFVGYNCNVMFLLYAQK